ncbi:hypothetical protein GQ44DRAFT_90893 [Phaeosphaeriaceae sp. PMI808]|nr:hypothetical protein GQ44DRAFT_90893 [Phaeosphaeriaceae sp. PMI808]
MADNLRGDGLEADPLGLSRRARVRFTQSPPRYRSYPSGTTTRSASPDTRSDEEKRNERRLYQLIEERAASLPREQFRAEVKVERERIWKTDPRTRRCPYDSIDLTFDEDARETVKKRWIEQGIWKDEWDGMADGLWKHEEPLELESELETDTEAVSLPRPFSFDTSPPPKPRQAKSDSEKRRIAERRAVLEREREASRPYHRFVYQISKERERIQSKSANGENADAADINTMAYENIKNTWTMRGSWNRKWGILPGMSWKHERPVDMEFAADDPAPIPARLLMIDNHIAGEAPTRRIFEFFSPTTSSHGQPSDIMSTSQQGPSADVDSAILENGDAVRSPSLSRPGIAEPLLPPRRSKRLEPPKPSTAKGPTGITSVDSPKAVARLRPKRNGAGNPKSMGSAKPQGISKKPRLTRTRGKARKKDD